MRISSSWGIWPESISLWRWAREISMEASRPSLSPLRVRRSPSSTCGGASLSGLSGAPARWRPAGPGRAVPGGVPGACEGELRHVVKRAAVGDVGVHVRDTDPGPAGNLGLEPLETA